MEGAAVVQVLEWDVNCFLPPAKVGRDGTCLIPKDNATARALARDPNPDEAVGYVFDAKKDGALIPPDSTNLIFPLLALTFRRLSQLRERAHLTERRVLTLEEKIQSIGYSVTAEQQGAFVKAKQTQQQQQQQQQQQGNAEGGAAAASGVCGICAAKNRYKVRVHGVTPQNVASMKHSLSEYPNQGQDER
uniref:Uncharacterized protein n=1 Tax=Chromera velia CCMP2878 TaxID=1169474 RepID=A0A0K6S7T2_9ALVE|eukprot:Cvel_21633.t1-p1 / transcript=Cvel_21633.t1 / gene=Cvel_21633 / organism=Chromera_velia_CCMP2878 / gene_product=hypothetical protein / transcript_product=hypothetical protein / location=Cvel_scaffold2045:10212-10994(+) / protein_length=189 / sequence_SO=supercontig / SO=protein_coding / is_pseudo=false